MKKIVVLLFALTMFIGCCEKSKVSEPWIPVLEQTDFTYLENAVEKCLKEEQNVEKALNKDLKSCEDKIKEAKVCMLKLKNYYIPLTEVRQMIYDSDRLYFLKKKELSIAKLKKADEILLKIGESSPILKKHTADLIFANNNLIVSITNSPNEVAEDFKKIARELNLLLNKGELVLENIKFTK